MRITIIAILLPFLSFSQTHLSSVKARVLDVTPVPIYKDAMGLNKIGEIAPNDFVFIVGRTDLYYQIYRKGIVGYSPQFRLEPVNGLPKLPGNQFEIRLDKAKADEEILDKEMALKKKLQSLQDSISTTSYIKAGISITYPEYIEGIAFCGFKFDVSNYNSKTIKYLYLTLSALNPVNDLVETKRFTFVGPILKSQNVSYENKTAFSNYKAISYYKIRKIEIEYTNKTKKEISGKLLESILN